MIKVKLCFGIPEMLNSLFISSMLIIQLLIQYNFLHIIKMFLLLEAKKN